jgi:hypothetical protein
VIYYHHRHHALLLCDTDSLLGSTAVSHAQPDFPFQKLSGNLQNPIYIFCPPPYCDAASYTSTLPTQKTTQTPPPQAVKPYYYYLLPTYLLYN